MNSCTPTGKRPEANTAGADDGLRPIYDEFAETGRIDGTRKWAQALNDSLTPGIIDSGEMLFMLRAKPDSKDAKLLSDIQKTPPLLSRLERLTFEATKNPQDCDCFDCADNSLASATEFLNYAAQPDLLNALSDDALQIFAQNADFITTFSQYKNVALLGQMAATLIEKNMVKRDAAKKSGTYSQLEGAYRYVAPLFELDEFIANPVKYWREIISKDKDTAVIAKRFTKKDIQTEDLKSVEKTQIDLNNDIGCKPEKARGKIIAWKCESDSVSDKRVDYYTYKFGQNEEIKQAVSIFRHWQPSLEAIFLEEGVPPYLAVLMIIESRSKNYAKSEAGATGPFQIMPANLGRPKYDLYADLKQNYDERENPLIAGRAAAKMLKESIRAITSDGFVDGVSINNETAAIMATSAYHAGLGNLRTALRMVNEKTGITDARELFACPITSSEEFGRFGDDSKDYPPQVIALANMIYGGEFENAEYGIPELSFVTVTGNTHALSIDELATQTFLELKEFNILNPHLAFAQALPQTNEDLPAVKLIVPTAVADRFTAALENMGCTASHKLLLNPKTMKDSYEKFLADLKDQPLAEFGGPKIDPANL